MADPPVAAAPPPSPRRRLWPKRAAMSVLGLTVGLALAEMIFRARDRGAFPHLNIYLPDAELGVRLEPNATQKVALPGDRVTTVHTNASGYRGAALPTPTEDEILVVGDSQVFGLGVEETETLSAQLAIKSGGRQVINAGVPTYGPLEYEKVAARLLEERKPIPSASVKPGARRTLVYVVNLANDVAEANRPNKERHKVWDGWAVRAESAPPNVTQFPGRQWLYRNSHAFYALRSWLYARGTQPAEALLPSAGEVQGLLEEAGIAKGRHEKADADSLALARLWHDEVEKAGKDVTASETAWKMLMEKMPEAIPNDPYGLEYKRNKGDPGDLVERGAETFFEGGGQIDYAYLVKGAAVREYVERQILLRAKEVLSAEKGKLVLDSFAAREEAEKRVEALRAKSIELVRAFASPLRPSLERTKKLCDDHHANLVVVVLPIDVQVSADEWKKYGQAPIDMTPTRLLNRDVVDAATSLGALAVDLLPTLEKAEPGAFFARDLHLTPKGQAAAAEAIAARLSELPASPEQPVVALTAGRTHVPLPAAWSAQKPLVVNTDILFPSERSDVATASVPLKGNGARFRGKVPEGCEAKRIDEWFRIVCVTPAKGPAPTGVVVRKGPANGNAADVMSMATAGVAMVMAPLVHDADRLEVDFAWGDVVRPLVVKLENQAVGLPAGTSTWEWSLTFGEATSLDATKKASFVATPGADALCACQKSIAGDATCAQLIGAPDHDCATTYAGDCARLVECVRGEPTSPPTCQKGWARAGSAQRCHRLCDAKNPCDSDATCMAAGEKDGSMFSVCLPTAPAAAAMEKPKTDGAEAEKHPGPNIGAAGVSVDDGYHFFVFGGCKPGAPGQCTPLAQTWHRRGGEWTSSTSIEGPGPRVFPAMAEDGTEEKVVLFGGTSDPTGARIDVSVVPEGLDDTWTMWASTGNWLRNETKKSPGGRVGAQMVFDHKRKVVVLFGGARAGTWLSDTWLWNGSDWSQATPAHAPPPRAHHSMFYDASHTNVVLFGGFDGGTELGDTWLWDGVDWTRAPTLIAPSRRLGGAFGFDGSSVTLFGGLQHVSSASTLVALDDLWRWDGTRWSLQLPATSTVPEARGFAFVAGSRYSATLFGGWDPAHGGASWVPWFWASSTWTSASSP